MTVPIAVKLSPYYTALANVALQLAEARADGLVLFNRFVQPDVDVAAIEVAPGLELSRPEELRVALRWLAILRGRVDVSLAATGGVHTTEDAVKAILVGADVVTMASALLREGVGRMRDVRAASPRGSTSTTRASRRRAGGSARSPAGTPARTSARSTSRRSAPRTRCADRAMPSPSARSRS